MLKRLAMLCLAVGLTGWAWSQVPRDRSQQNQKAEQGDAEPHPAPPIPQKPQSQQGTTTEKQQPHSEPARYQWGELFAPANIPDWCLVLVGGLAAGMAYRTIRSIEGQTEQLKSQSGLMRQQMDRAVERERARLSLEVQPLSVDDSCPDCTIIYACLEMTNSGHSNAYVRFGAVRFIATEAGKWPLPEPDPDQFSGVGTMPPSEEPTYVGLNMEFYPFNEFADKLADASLRLCFYGFVEYESMGIIWHRDFGYIWSPDDDVWDGKPIISEVSKMGKIYLRGDWEPDLRQKYTEYQQPQNPN